MDSMYDFPMFEHGIHDTNQKLQYYRNIISFLLGELKTLQAAMCTSCREKCGSLPATGSGSQSFSTPNDLSLELRPLKRRHMEDDIPALPRIAEIDTFSRTPQASTSSSPSENETNSVVKISNESSTKSDGPTFYAQKADLADTTFGVGFEHSFYHENNEAISLCFSRDGGYLAVGLAEDDRDDQGSIAMYEVASRAKYCELREYASQYGSYKRPVIESLCFNANGRYLASGDNKGRVIIWDLPNKRIRSIFQGHDGNYVSEVFFSPDGRLVAFCNNFELLVLNVRDNSRNMTSKCSCFDFSPDGRRIATGNYNGDLAILDVRTGKAVKKWNAHQAYLKRVMFTSDGNMLCSYYEVIEHWDLNEAEPILIWKSDIRSSLYLQNAISPDNRLVASSNELCDVNSGKRQCILEGHNGIVDSVDFSAAGTYLAMADSWSGVVSLWKYTWT